MASYQKYKMEVKVGQTELLYNVQYNAQILFNVDWTFSSLNH